jgi:hypothetical protein
MPRAGLRSSGKTANAVVEMREHLKTLLAAAEVVLSAELAELLRWRNCVGPHPAAVAQAGAALPDGEGDTEAGRRL